MSSLLSRLFALVAVAILPAIAIQAYNEIDLRRTRQVEVQDEVLGLAKLAAAEQQQIVLGVRQAMTALSELPAIKEKDVQGCNAYLSRIKQRYPEFIVFIVVDINGNSFCDSTREHKPSTAAGRAYFASVVKTGQFTVGEFAVGRTTGRNVLQFALPFYDDQDRMGGIVVAALSLDWLADYIAKKGVPTGAALAITDRNGICLARYPDNALFVGKKLPAGKDPTLSNGTVEDMVNIDGVRRIVGFAAVGEDLLVSYGLGKAQTFTKIEHRTQRDVLFIFMGALVVLILTAWGAQRFIQRPFAQLVDAANRWRLGEFGRRLDIPGNSEIARVARAFNAMADALKHREHELSEAREQFHQSQKMESVGQLTGGVAHDFNNLLTVVSANLELIEAGDDIGKIRHFAAAARRAVDRGAKLTAQLLAFSRRQILNPRPVNTNQLVSEFQGIIRKAVGEACRVKVWTSEGLWLCHVDPARLETALLNLALNARDAMPNGGVLDIEMKNVVVGEGAVAGCLPGSYVRLSVRDTGSGMPPEVRNRVFEPFFTTKEVGKGSGLGLSMVYGFVRQSGGHIAVESALGKGTTVSLYLPRATQTPSVELDDVRSQAFPAGSERVLVVEDNDDLLDLTSAMLTRSGYQVRCARNGTEALRLLRSEEFDLLLSDIVMPNGINGIEVAREARKLNKGIKILLASGYAGDALDRHQAVGEFPIIDKPFRMSELAARLRSILHEA
ncbi:MULTISPECIES: ATP-binding protein [unclassified Bradyrhizobium]|uniref:ATP-binding protein n=1 Tax=unclassified Bradyrhizobium TaxID=2631580 RepID=UPI00102EA584|nr:MULTISPECIES: ATP-binding protein [unclassified Bradyrhizobium]MDI4237372.1 ATP-binding protein [Bradyrhizobium sp. Arg237L]TAI63353.1 hybrid sensor histidine kinase/response regulator [Bradyrhizobium sp. Leo170]